METAPKLIALDAIAAADDGEAAPFPIRLWDYSTPRDPALDGGPAPEPALSEPALPEPAPFETVLIIHGRRNLLPDRAADLEELYPRLDQLAQQTAAPGKRVLFLDWGEAAVGSLPPFSPARRIKAVAGWATEQLQPLALTSLTLVGHSLGSYVAAEIAQALAPPSPNPASPHPAVNLVALDPAFPAQDYDIDGLTDGRQPVAAFSQATSLAFVAEDDLFQTGIAGDNKQAGTAETSFVVDLKGLRGIFDADNAHGAVIDVYRDFERYLRPTDSATPWVLAQFPRDRIGDRGDLEEDGLHEGVVNAAQAEDIWKISSLEGDGVTLHFVGQVDDGLALGAEAEQDGTELDIVASLISLHLPMGFEHLVLGGEDDLDGTGRGTDNALYGNSGNNFLRGRGGDDDLYGGDGDDILVGNSGGDRLMGQRGADQLLGDFGNDLLVGGGGADWLLGGKGRNRLMGGAGRDTFMLQPAAGFDIIEDFQTGLDQLAMPVDLSFNDLRLVTRSSGLLIRAAGDAIALLAGVTRDQIDAADFGTAPVRAASTQLG